MLNVHPRTSRRRNRLTHAMVAMGAASVLALGALAPNAMAVTELATPEADVIATTAEPVEVAPVDGPTAEPTESVEPGDMTVEPTTPPEPAEPTGEEESSAGDATQEPSTDAVDDLDGALVTEENFADDSGFVIFSDGPDGESAPYVYWSVVDTDGNLVEGATFEFERMGRLVWTGDRDVSDCVAAACNSYDRDTDGGEFLVKGIGGSNNITGTQVQAGDRYRIRPVDPPPGHEWVTSTNWVDSNSRSWVGTGSNQTLDFGKFEVRKLQTAPICTAGYVYGISANGQIQQVAPDGTVTNIGARASDVTSFNGIGIGSDGASVFGYERTNSIRTATIWTYDTATGLWSSTGASINSTNSSRTVDFVAGAVNLQNGLYYLGGFSSNGTVFRVWEYNPATNAITYKGHLNTSSGAGGANNGDLAFDAAGNMFVVRGSGTTTTVFSVTAENLAGASGSTITSSRSASVTTMNNVNGVAFDASGKAFLGSSSQLRSYDMPNWSNSSTVVSSNLNSTDLATCSSPPTITIEKEILGGRVHTDDQFKLTLHQGATLLGDATTTGTETGIQDDRVGPLPTVRGVELSFAETADGTTNLNDYASAYQCTVTYMNGEVDSLAEVNGTSGTITIPATGEAVECVFRNAPLVAGVTIHKDVTDSAGENPEPREGWTVGATTTATTGTATVAPETPTQQTDEDGDASWSIRFGTAADRATVTVAETQQDGYQFESGQCVITHLNGSTATTELTNADATSLTGIGPGDYVECSYVNKPATGQLEIEKAFDVSVPEGSGVTVAFTGTYACVVGTDTVASGTWASTGVGTATLTPAGVLIPVDAECSVTENQPTGSDGLPAASWEWGDYSTDGPVTIEADKIGTITVTNTAAQHLGSVTWNKVDDSDPGTLLSGSEWTIVGPSFPAPGDVVTDCDEATAEECTGLDKDPVAGQFLIVDLEWGDYVLSETKAPAGYFPIPSPIEFTIGAGADLNVELDPVVNDRIDGPALPLTGGLGRDFFTITGLGILVLGLGAVGVTQVRNRREVA